MKQKRKEETLLSGKVGLRGGLILTILSVLGGAIGLVILGLQAKPVSAQPIPEPTPEPAPQLVVNEMRLDYTGVNDNVETLRGLYFLDRDLKEELYKVYESGSSLYVTPRNVVVNDFVADGVTINHASNQVNGVYGHVLGGKDNKVSSDNVTIIGGNDNEIQGSNTNAVLLGGVSNKMFPGRNLELVLVGGLGNKMLTPNGLAGIIGGTGNTIFDQSSEATILGGYQSEIHGANAIVGGNKVVVGDNANNVFAFTDNRGLNIGSEGSDAFYLNVEKGLGINKGSSEGGVETSGAVGFGDVDINTDACDSANYGVQGVWNIGGNIGCMVGCTEQGWELMDSSDECRAACNEPINSNCKDNPPDEMYGAVEGKCVGSINHYQAERCPGRSPEPYLNVMFEEALVDVGLCDRLPDNQCTYVCKSGTHLVNDTLNMQGRSSQGTGCYQDCGLPWDTSTKKKHGETVIGYDTNQEYCAYPDNDSHNPKSIWTCDKDHKAELICVDGTWYNNQTKQKDNGVHSNGECDQKGYSCDATKYNLTEYDITHGEFAENPGDVSFDHNVDRGNGSVGKRGHYKLCINFVGGGKEHNEQCNVQTPEEDYGYKYEAECINGVTEKVNGKCAYMCEDLDGEMVSQGEERWVYEHEKPDCDEFPGGCNRLKLTCSDGVWYDTSGNPEDITRYHKDCSVKPICEGRDIENIWATLFELGIDNLTATSNCYPDNSKFCTEPKHRFEHCNGESHTESSDYCDLIGINCWPAPLGPSKQGSNERYCIPNTITRYCVEEGKQGGDETEYFGQDNPIVYEWKNSEWINRATSEKQSPEFPSNCSRKCKDENKEWDGEHCVTPQYDCEGTKPSGEGILLPTGPDKYLAGASITNWQDGYVDNNGGTLLGCQWKCEGDYRPNNDRTGCELIPKCEGDAPSGAQPINGIGDSSSSVTNTLYESLQKANNNYCSYVCPSGTEPYDCDSEGKCSGGCVDVVLEKSCQDEIPTKPPYVHGATTYLEGYTTYTKWTRVGDNVPEWNLGSCEYKCDTDSNYYRNGRECEQEDPEPLDNLCGGAKDGIYTDASKPNTNLCEDGAEKSTVTKTADGLKFTWTCKKSTKIDTCTATRVACGSAVSTVSNPKSYTSKPTDNLCNNPEYAKTVYESTDTSGNPIYKWSCEYGSVSVSCTAGRTEEELCGGAKGGWYTDDTKPSTTSSTLCKNGASLPAGGSVNSTANGLEFIWTCEKGTNTETCIANRVACGSAASTAGNPKSYPSEPTDNLCNKSEYAPSSVTQSTDKYTWECKKAGTTAKVSCEANVQELCGDAKGKVYTDDTKPSTTSSILCKNGASLSVGGSVNTTENGLEYTWECKKGNDINTCTATRVACGTAHNNAFANTPNTDLCNANSEKDLGVSLVDNQWTWSCKGKTDSTVKVNCNANITLAECGDASKGGKEYAVKPTTSDGLCDSNSTYDSSKGVTDGIDGEGKPIYQWTCKRGVDEKKCTALKIECGTAHGESFGYSETPSSNLCINSELYQDVELLTNKYRWKCKGEVSGNIKSDYCEATRRPDGHAKCDLREPYGCENATSIKKVDDTSKTEWQWYCKGEDDVGDGAYCHVNCNDLGENGKDLVWTDTHVGSCVKSEDGECDFKTAKCKNNGVNDDRYDEKHTDYTNGEKTWECKGLGKGKNTLCYMRWECEGNCSGNGNECGTAYSSMSLNTEDSCKAAGVYGKGNSVTGLCRLRAGGNIGGGYIPSCDNLRFDSTVSCSDYPYCWYHACFNFTNPQKVCYTKVDNGTETKLSASDCDTSIRSDYNTSWCTASNSHTLSFDKNGCNSTNQITRYLAKDDPLSFLSVGADCGEEEFKEWNDKADCSGTTWTSASTMPNNDLKLYACSKAKPTTVAANIRNISSNCYVKGDGTPGLKAIINGNVYTTSCIVSPGKTGTCSFEGEPLMPGKNYTIKLISNDGKYCELDPDGNEQEIDKKGWLGGRASGQTNGYYRDCSCKETGPECGRATEYSNPRDNKSDLCSEGSYSNMRVEYDRKTNSSYLFCEPQYKWDCKKGGETKSCTNTAINKIQVGLIKESGQRNGLGGAPVQPGGMSYTSYWWLSTNTYNPTSEARESSAPGLGAQVLYYSDDTHMHMDTVKISSPYPILWTDLNPFEIIKIEYEPKYSSDWGGGGVKFVYPVQNLRVQGGNSHISCPDSIQNISL